MGCRHGSLRIKATRHSSASRPHVRSSSISRPPEAKTVQLAGDFTRWEQSAVEMTRVGDGVWKASVPISAGRHSYRLIVDGQWREDPCGVLREPNPFGSYNTVIEVR